MDRVRTVVHLRRPLGRDLLPQLARASSRGGARGASHRTPAHVARRWDAIDDRGALHLTFPERACAAPAAVVAGGPRVFRSRGPGACAGAGPPVIPSLP